MESLLTLGSQGTLLQQSQVIQMLYQVYLLTARTFRFAPLRFSFHNWFTVFIQRFLGLWITLGPLRSSFFTVNGGIFSIQYLVFKKQLFSLCLVISGLSGTYLYL